MFALRMASDGVCTFDVRPGMIKTEMSRDVWPCTSDCLKKVSCHSHEWANQMMSPRLWRHWPAGHFPIRPVKQCTLPVACRSAARQSVVNRPERQVLALNKCRHLTEPIEIVRPRVSLPSQVSARRLAGNVEAQGRNAACLSWWKQTAFNGGALSTW